MKRMRGFTLVELMTTVAVVAVLAAVAYPTYTGYAERARRAEGRAALLQAANALERFFTANNTYTTNLTAAQYKAYSGDTAANSAYALTVAAGPNGIDRGFTLTATPAIPDGKCGVLTLTHTGVRGAAGPQAADQCWGR